VLVPVKEPLGNVMVNGFGVIETAARFATPAPVSVTGVPFTTTPAVV